MCAVGCRGATSPRTSGACVQRSKRRRTLRAVAVHGARRRVEAHKRGGGADSLAGGSEAARQCCAPQAESAQRRRAKQTLCSSGDTHLQRRGDSAAWRCCSSVLTAYAAQGVLGCVSTEMTSFSWRNVRRKAVAGARCRRTHWRGAPLCLFLGGWCDDALDAKSSKGHNGETDVVARRARAAPRRCWRRGQPRTHERPVAPSDAPGAWRAPAKV